MEKLKIKLNTSEMLELYMMLEMLDFYTIKGRTGPMVKELCSRVYKRIVAYRLSHKGGTLGLSEAEASAVDICLGNIHPEDNYRRNLVIKLRMIIDQFLA